MAGKRETPAEERGGALCVKRGAVFAVESGISLTARSGDFLAGRNLADTEECFDEFALAANDHLRKALKPTARWNLGICREPI